MSDGETKEMYVQQIDWELFTSVIDRITTVNRLYMYNMPNKAEKYADDIVGMIQTLDGYLAGEDEWRITKEKNVPFKYDKENDKLMVGSWVLGKAKLVICIPKLNSFFIVPNSDARYKDTPSPTMIIQLNNCISVMPMLLDMKAVPDTKKEGSYNISMAYEMINQP